MYCRNQARRNARIGPVWTPKASDGGMANEMKRGCCACAKKRRGAGGISAVARASCEDQRWMPPDQSRCWKRRKRRYRTPCLAGEGISCMATLSFVPTHACDPPPFGCRSTPLHPRRPRFFSCPTWCDPPLPPVANNTCACRWLHTCSRPVCWRGHVTRMRDTLPTVCEPRPPHHVALDLAGKGGSCGGDASVPFVPPEP